MLLRAQYPQTKAPEVGREVVRLEGIVGNATIGDAVLGYYAVPIIRGKKKGSRKFSPLASLPSYLPPFLRLLAGRPSHWLVLREEALIGSLEEEGRLRYDTYLSTLTLPHTSRHEPESLLLLLLRWTILRLDRDIGNMSKLRSRRYAYSGISRRNIREKKSVSTRPRQEVPENVGHILYGLSGAHRYFTMFL